jgi:predicted chitinase
VNVSTLCAAMPGLSAAKAAAYLPLMETAMRQFSITSKLRSAMWLAQCGHESESFVYFEEIASGAAYEGRLDLGNTHPGDGVRFKGRGPIQITGRSNYTAASQALGIDLVGHPEIAAQPQYGFLISAWWWGAHGINAYADRGDVVGATRVINGGENGLSDREYRYTLVTNLGDAVIVSPLKGDWFEMATKQDLKDALTELGVLTHADFPEKGKYTDRIAERAARKTFGLFGNSLQLHAKSNGLKVLALIHHFGIKMPGDK